MASKREVKNRLRGIRKTRQITQAMKMVATIKLRQAQAALAGARPYADRIKALAAEVVSQIEIMPDDIFFVPHRQVEKVLFIVVASDRGLCGSLNANIFREVLRAVDDAQRPARNGRAPEVQLLLIGRKARDFFKARQNLHPEGLPYYVKETVAFAGVDAGRLGAECCALYRQGEFDRVEFFYNASSSALQHRPARTMLLPFDIARLKPQAAKTRANVIFEPPCGDMLADVVGAYIVSAIREIMLEADVTEQAARMLMMDLATKNADELMLDMQLTMNKLRQLSITTELEDITTGAEAVG